MTLSAISIMTITLLTISVLLVISQLTSLSAKNLEDRVDISVFFDEEVSTEKLQEIKQDFEQLDEVRSIKVITAEEALNRFQERYKDDPLVQQTLNELSQNPLQASLILTANNLDQYPVLFQKLQRSRFEPLIDKISYEDKQTLIETLKAITAGIRTFGIVLIIVFGAVAVLVMFNTLRLTIFSRKEEIEIMRLVGASNSYIRGPFLIEGVFYGVLATLAASIIFYPLLATAAPYIEGFFGIRLSEGAHFVTSYWQLVLIQFGIGVLLGIFSSVVATKKYLER